MSVRVILSVSISLCVYYRERLFRLLMRDFRKCKFEENDLFHKWICNKGSENLDIIMFVKGPTCELTYLLI